MKKDLGFAVIKWRGELRNAEPEKRDEIRWALCDKSPEKQCQK